MSKRKPPAAKKAPLPAQGGNFIRNKDGSLTPEAKPAAPAAVQTPPPAEPTTPDGKPED